MLSHKQAYALLLSLATVASAAPTVADGRSALPEVIPGPGLPSLESLGLNSTYLYSLGKPENLNDGEMTIMADSTCGTNYGSRSIIMCTAGDIHVEGYGIGHSSWCKHVAVAVLWVVDHCTRPAQDTAGYAPAYGNGNLIIGTQR
ncbi:hypothetical protein E8E12_002447 [Didymella heteroderae]|uniref:Uncharacterized protein n=1 Tax=Didymella heteroderae TaxID=1769908 RepID=A0A9P4WY52_9PLEO|nr:hypothetical protein E8E12_002447 [Didymella heteroderae]